MFHYMLVLITLFSNPIDTTFYPLPEHLNSNELKCLADNMYYEARGEPTEGQIAVAQVTLNRVNSPRFPNSICDVVHQRYQFSWTIPRIPYPVREKDVYQDLYRLSIQVLSDPMDQVDFTDGALWYHTTQIKPRWSTKLRRVKTIGNHVFYKE